LGAKLLHHRPSRLLLVNMLGVSVGTFFLVHYLSYYAMDPKGTQLRAVVPFTEYMRLVLTKSAISFRVHASKVGETGELGKWGYAYALLQILGFAAGGLAAYFNLADSPFCDACARYLKKVRTAKRYTADAGALKSLVETVHPLMDARRLGEAVDAHATFGKEKPVKG